MSGDSALKLLSEQVSLICSEYRSLRQRCAALERKIEKLSRDSRKSDKPAKSSRGHGESGSDAGMQFDKELVRAKVEELLAELADIG